MNRHLSSVVVGMAALVAVSVTRSGGGTKQPGWGDRSGEAADPLRGWLRPSGHASGDGNTRRSFRNT